MCLALLALALAPRASHAEPAATAQFVFGAVHLVAADGSQRPLSRTGEIRAGETVVTEADGRAHLRFADGSFVSLSPNSEFRIDDFRYAGKPDPSDRLGMSLLKGGLRTITGEIGRLTRDAYKMATRVATTGIRGTEYTVQYVGPSVTGSVAGGRIEVCNAAGCLELGAGQSYFVLDENTRPALTDQAADLAPPQPAAVSDIDDSLRSNNPPPANGGNGGVGFNEIGITAPNVDTPATGGVSGVVHEGNHPGQGWGRGGNPGSGPQR
ncbi:MAG TPA: FecR family protein [Burkholderiales bacterium]|nr:FecR family protein [Burkholderiales bacterium]